MAYQIKYAYTCHIGKIRNNNEDNFWCCGEFLNAQNQGMSHIQSGCRKQSELPVMAVFDGMGGESCGEMAAFLAAESCGLHYKEQKDRIRRDGEQFLLEACEKMNQAVCDYGTENRIDSMGTTAAMLAFGEDMIYAPLYTRVYVCLQSWGQQDIQKQLREIWTDFRGSYIRQTFSW